MLKIEGNLHFTPYLLPTLWGGENIPAIKGMKIPDVPVGESWEISAMPGKESIVDRGPYAGMSLDGLMQRFGASLAGTRSVERYGMRFPLLLKFIDTRSDLSIQVHPDDEMAGRLHGANGKTEMWYIISTKPNARVLLGFRKPLNPEEFDSHVAAGSIPSVLASFPCHPGDTFFLPAGRIHSIGAGNLLAEVQQSSDITYRVDDFGRLDSNGRPRQLHVDNARQALDFNDCADPHTHRRTIGANIERLAECQHFIVDKIEVNGETHIPADAGTFRALMCTAGNIEVLSSDDNSTSDVLTLCDSLLIPACSPETIIRGSGTILLSFLP